MNVKDLILTQWIELDDGLIYWDPEFLTPCRGDHYFQQLQQLLHWRQLEIRMFGRDILQPRLQAWYGEKEYRYSGLTMQPLPWNAPLLSLKQRCEDRVETRFNTVLANLYRTGSDYMGWHADNEKELGENPVIASVSLGGSRRFVLRHRQTREKFELELSNGSLLIMAGRTQDTWEHQVPKTQRRVAPRINLTYRMIKN